MLTYRTKKRLQRTGLIALVLAVVSVLVWLCWVIWVERYMVYSREGAKLDFEYHYTGTGQLAAPPRVENPVEIHYNEGEEAVADTTVLSQFSGYYIGISDLQLDMAGTQALVDSLPGEAAVMLEVKDAKGKFYYSTGLSDAPLATTVDTVAVSALISRITQEHYAIAVLPAFRDYSYGLNHTNSGLAVPRGYLWADSDYCYWLNPTRSEVLNRLKAIVEELRSLGFREVVFTEFKFPNTTEIIFNGDRTEAITKAAAEMVSSCATSTFALSFQGGTDFPLPAGRSRLYLKDIGARDAESVAAAIAVTDPAVNLVFHINTFDTRFDGYSVIRPLDTYSDVTE